MDEKDKKGEFSIRTNFIKWLNIEGLDSASFLFGNISLGKSTICHLLKRVIDNYQDPNLKLVQKKKDFEYEYEGQLNTKSTKPLTIYPKLYRIEGIKENIIEVPWRIYQLEKKRPYLDKLLTMVGIGYAAKKGKFLFCIDSRNTSNKVQPWKKSFQIPFDYFDEQYFDLDMLNSVGFIITKGPNDIDKEIYLTRMPDIKQLLIQDFHKDLYLDLLKTIEEKKRLEVFAKISSQETAHNDIKSISKLFANLMEGNLHIKKNGFQLSIIKTDPIQLSKDEEVLYNNFKENLQLILDFFIRLFNKLLSAKGNFDMKSFLESEKDKLDIIVKKILSDQEKPQFNESKVLIQKYFELTEISAKRKDFYQSALGRGLFFVEYKQKMIKNTQIKHQYVKKMLQIFAENGIIMGNIQQLRPIYMQLIVFSLFEQRFGPLISNVNFKSLFTSEQMTKAFSEENEKLVKQAFLSSKFSPDENSQNSKLILDVLGRLFREDEPKDPDIEQKVTFIKNLVMLASFDTSSPEKGIPQIFEELQNFIQVKKLPQIIYENRVENLEKEIEFLNKLALLLAQMLTKFGRSDLCYEIYRDSGQYFSGKRCIEIKLKQLRDSRQSLEIVQPILWYYLDLLSEMSLTQKALEICFQYAQIYKELTQKLLGKMKQIKQKEKQPFSEEFEKRFTREGFKLIDFYRNNELLQKIRIVVSEIKK